MSNQPVHSVDELKRIALRMRLDIVKMIGAAGSGHVERLVGEMLNVVGDGTGELDDEEAVGSSICLAPARHRVIRNGTITSWGIGPRAIFWAVP